MVAEVVRLPPQFRHDQPGYFSLANLPQQAPMAEEAFGTGWWEMDQIFKFYRGQFIVTTGIAGHGKSTFMLNMLLNIARTDGIASFLYVPENEAFLRDKLRAVWNDELSFPHFADGLCFVQSSRSDRYDEPAHTLHWVLEKAVVAIERDNAEIILIDPWNELDRARPRDMLMTDYIGECLMVLKQFCRSYNVVVIVVAHPTKSVTENGGRVAGLADIEGSMNWFNKCDNGLIVVRDPEKNTAKVISAKVRETGAGKIGVCHFYVDPVTGIFTPQKGGVYERGEGETAKKHNGHARRD